MKRTVVSMIAADCRTTRAISPVAPDCLISNRLSFEFQMTKTKPADRNAIDLLCVPIEIGDNFYYL